MPDGGRGPAAKSALSHGRRASEAWHLWGGAILVTVGLRPCRPPGGSLPVRLVAVGRDLD
jgi:hypothetical protein